MLQTSLVHYLQLIIQLCHFFSFSSFLFFLSFFLFTFFSFETFKFYPPFFSANLKNVLGPMDLRSAILCSPGPGPLICHNVVFCPSEFCKISPQSLGNGISETLDSKIFRMSMPWTPRKLVHIRRSTRAFGTSTRGGAFENFEPGAPWYNVTPLYSGYRMLLFCPTTMGRLFIVSLFCVTKGFTGVVVVFACTTCGILLVSITESHILSETCSYTTWNTDKFR
jgi:hypothetical protein